MPLLACACFASIAAPAQEEEPVEFPNIIYRTEVWAPDPRSGCPYKSPATTMAYLPCEPDSYEDMCRWTDKKARDQAARKEARMKPYLDALAHAKESAYRATLAKLGPIPDAKSPTYPAYRKAFVAMRDKIYSSESDKISASFAGQLEESRSKVMATLQKIRETMIRAAQPAPKLAGWDYMIDKILNCDLDVKLNPAITGDNATMGTGDWTNGSSETLTSLSEEGTDLVLVSNRPSEPLPRHGAFRLTVNPLDQTRFKCHLSMGPTEWMDCAEGNASCLYMMFHEFGHTLNSCLFYDMSSVVSKLRSDHFPDGQHASEDSDQKKDTILSFLENESLRFARKLVSNSSCLSAISGAHEAVVDRCPQAANISEEFRKRCNIGSVKGYPSEWSEAEADFWAATGIAKYLEENVPSVERRTYEFYSMWAQQCASMEQVGARKEILAPDVLAILKKLGPDPDPGKAPPAAACKSQPLNPTKDKPWNDVHQDWRTRANRNFMRNSDLRRALGCPASDPRIPLVCSPVR